MEMASFGGSGSPKSKTCLHQVLGTMGLAGKTFQGLAELMPWNEVEQQEFFAILQM